MHTEYRTVITILTGFLILAVASILSPTVDLVVTVAGTVAITVGTLVVVLRARHNHVFRFRTRTHHMQRY